MAERAILCEDVENHAVVKPTPSPNANVNVRDLDPKPDPDPDSDHKELIHVESSRSIFPSDTYVVQVPKDQIYRIPPPENALIAEQRRNPSPKSKRSCCHCLLFVFLVIIVKVILVGITIGITSILLKPKDPAFRVDHFLLTNSSSHSHKSSYGYKIRLEVGNPNANYGILYKEGGLVSLSCKQQKIAGGFYPSLEQGKKNTTFVQLNLNGSTTALPKDMEESMKRETSKVHVSFQLTMKIPSRMKILVTSRNYDFSISCNFVVDTLVGSSRILSQQCQAKH